MPIKNLLFPESPDPPEDGFIRLPRRKPTTKSTSTVKVKEEVDASEVYYINETIRNSITLPENFEPPIRVRKVREVPYTAYRVTIYTFENKTVVPENGLPYKKKGRYVYRQWFVSKIREGEYLYEPALTESALEPDGVST